MEKSCDNCRFCIATKFTRGKAKLYCEWHKKWLWDIILCSEWEMVSVPKPITHGDQLRAMSDEELAAWIETFAPSGTFQFWLNGKTWLQWLRQEAGRDERAD